MKDALTLTRHHQNKLKTKMGRLLLSLLIIFLCSSNIFAGVEISDFSFIGKEVTNFNIRPVYKNISVDFKNIKAFDTYIDKLNFEVNDISKDDYSTKEPGFMFSGDFGAAISSAFIGSRAYRNYLAKMYLRKDYLKVIEGFEKYEEKLTGSDFKDECTFLYATSLMNVGYYDKSLAYLSDLATKDNQFGNLAQEYLFDYYKEMSKNDTIIELANKYLKLTPYSLYIYIDTLFKLDKYEEIVKVIDNYIDLADNYPFFYDYYFYSKYILKDFEGILKNANKGTKNSYPVFIDIYLSKGERSKAFEYIERLEDDELKSFFKVKSKIYRGDYLEALTDLKSIKNENYLSNLFFELMSKAFPNIEVSLLDKFNFKDSYNIDYKNFYKGLLFLKKSDYLSAASSFEKITFNELLLLNSYYYKGLAYFYVNKDLAEVNLKRFILEGKDKQKLDSARYLLGQIYLNRNQTDTALIVLESCSTFYCEELKGEIFIINKEYDVALEYLKNVETDRGNYLKGVIAFNRKDYESALKYVKKIKKSDIETDYLLMSIYFKLNRPDAARAIVEEYKNNKQFFDSAVNYYFLKGDYERVLYLLDSTNYKDDNYLLLRGKSLYSLKKYKEAESIFFDLLNRDKYVYDSIFGIINIKRVKGDSDKYVDEIFKLIKDRKFDRKGQLVIELAKESVNQNNLQSAIYILNYYFDNFSEAKNNKDAYLLRGDIFKKLGRFKECVKDTEYLISKFLDNDDAYLLQAECYEPVDKSKAISVYEKLIGNKRFDLLSKKRLLNLYENPDKIIQIANSFIEDDRAIYLEGIKKALKLVGDNKNILNYKSEIDNLIDSEIKGYVLAGIYFNSLYLYYQNDFKNSVKYSMKAYYLDKNSEFSKLSLENAIRSYTALGNKANAEKVKKILKDLK